MKSKLILIVLSVILVLSCCTDYIVGNGNITETNREIGNFKNIEVGEGLGARLSQGDTNNLIVKTDSNLQEYIITETTDSTLKIRVKEDNNLNPTQNIQVYLTFQDNIEKISANSGSYLDNKPQIEGENVTVNASSGAEMKIDIKAERLHGYCSSGSSIKLKGRSDYTRLSASSGAEIVGREFTADEVEAEASSGSRISIVARNKIDAKASSGAYIKYKGDPKQVSKKESSGAKIIGTN